MCARRIRGRKHDADWKPGPNHEIIRRALYRLSLGNHGEWSTIKQVQMFLNDQVGRNQGEWEHKGKSTYWTQLAVEDPMSDLRGIDAVESVLPARGREWLYRIREGAA